MPLMLMTVMILTMAMKLVMAMDADDGGDVDDGHWGRPRRAFGPLQSSAVSS